MKTLFVKYNKIITILLLITLSISAYFLFFQKTQTAVATWWNDSWQYRKALTINSVQVAGDLTDFPVLVSLTDTNLSGHAQDDGDDFIFIDKEGKKLSHEIESYASSTGVLVAWVKIPALSSSVDTDIFMYYGNAGVGSQEDVVNVWDTGYKGVWHLNDSSVNDSSVNNNSGTVVNAVSTSTGAKIGDAFTFDGAGDYLNIPYSSDFDIGSGDATWGMWISENNFNNYSGVISHTNGTQGDNGWWLTIIPSSNNGRIYFVMDNSDHASLDISWSTSTYSHIVVVKEGSVISYYRNGLFLNSDDNSRSINNSTSTLRIGLEGSSYGDQYFEGEIDEVRFSNKIRSANWIQTEYNNQNNPFLFFAEQAEETGPGPVGYWSFNEGYGTTAHDESANKNDGTITGAVWKDESECVSGRCLWFDGIDLTKIDTGTVDSGNNMEEFTVCSWFKANTLVNTDSDSSVYLISKMWHIKVENDGTLKFIIRTSGVYPEIDSRETIDVNKWYHVCGIFNGVGSAPDLFLNGVDNGGTTISGSGVQDDDSSYPIRIGTFTLNDSFGNFEGYIDEVKIYPYARTADQIKQDYNAGLSGVSSKSGVAASFGGSSDKWMSDGLVGYWKMDEMATTSGAIDASGNSNDGTYIGNASTTGGKFGNGGEFDGSGDYVEEDVQLISNYPFTLSGWVKSAVGMVVSLVDKDTTNVIYGIQIGSGNLAEIRVRNTTNIVKAGTTDFSDGNWHHVVGVFNSSIDRKLYVDGIIEASDSDSVSYNSAVDRFSIGRTGDLSPDNYLDGQIDEVRIYNRALSKSEVRKLYEWAPGPVMHLKMDEKSGGTAYDSVASSSFQGGNDGILTNGPTWTQGKYGGALKFDGNNDYVLIPNFGTRILNSAGSLAVWMKRDELRDGNDYIFSQYGSSGHSPSLRLDGGDAVNFTKNTINSQSAIVNTDWHYLAVTWDTVGQNLYIDGILTDSDGVGTINPSGDAAIGVYVDGLIGYFPGLIDDVRIYNYARTQKQILEDMNGGGPANKSPVLHLSFDEGRGETVYDSSIYKNNGTAYVGTGGSQTATSSMWKKSGKKNGAMEFDGTDDYVDTNVSLVQSDFTISSWFKTSDVSDYGMIVSKESTGGTPWNYRIYTNITNGFLIGDIHDGTNASTVSTDFSVVDDEWHFAMFKRDTVADKIYLYLDGELIASAVDITTGAEQNAQEVWIGRSAYSGGSGYYFSGFIDELKIWNFTLNEDEIKEEYNSGGAIVMGGGNTSANDDGTIVTGASTQYCIPGDTATCSPPVLELKMDKKSGGVAYDTSGNGNDGTISGATHSRGKVGAGLSFDGADDLINAGSASVLDNLGPLTYSVWIYPESSGENSQGRIMGKFNGTNWQKGLAMYSSTGQIAFFDTSDDWLGRATVNNSIEYNKWQYISVVWNGGLSFSDIDIYINGIEASYAVNDSSISVLDNSSYDFHVGNSSAGVRAFDGLIDDVRVYNYARTPAQIAYDYNKGKPIAHYKFDECSGSVIHDESGKGNHGALVLGSSGVTATGTCASSSDSFWYNGRTGKKNGSGSFDGGDDYVDISDSLILEPETISFGAWVKVEGIGTHSDGSYVLSKGRVGAQPYESYAMDYDHDDEAIKCKVAVDGVLRVVYSATTFITPIDWVYIMCTYDGADIKIYVDGILESTANYPGNIDYGMVANDDLYIGKWGYNTSWERVFDGQIDEVQIYNYALTAEQVKNVYNDGAVSFQ